MYIFFGYFIENRKEWEEQLYQYHAEIMHGRTAKELAKNMEKVFNEVHYQCLVCLYRWNIYFPINLHTVHISDSCRRLVPV